MKLLIIGSTGLVGQSVLKQALAHSAITHVIAPTRRPLAKHAKLENPVVDFENLPTEAVWWKADAVACTLGTTIKVAGSQETFYRVDHDYPLMVAELAFKHDAKTFVLNSATGANASSKFFYNRVKGKLEQDLKKLGFKSLTFVQPGLIGGDRNEFRLGEKIAQVVMATLRPILPAKLQTNEPEWIAKQIINAALESKPGVHVISPEQIVLGR